jgi:anaerobic magnesium-protoporphyrin IX monomethyl ester cyclase
MLNVMFLQDNGINESLGVTDLAAVLTAEGHRVELVLGDEEKNLRRRLRASAPDLVVVPCPVAGHERALSDAQLVKELHPDCVTVLGGTYATFSPDLARLPQVDTVCIGEAEGAVVELAERISGKESYDDVANLVVERDGELIKNPMRGLIEDLDSLPFPDRDLYFRAYPFVAELPWKKFATGRGCFHECGFCWNDALREMYEGGGRFTRRKSPRRAVDEVLQVKGRYPLEHVHFSDDLFTVHPAWLEEFAPIYRDEVGVPFTCNSSIPLVTERTMSAVAEAGCVGVGIGLECGNEALRGEILGKVVTNEDVHNAARLVKGHGMQLSTFNMVASPGETVENVWETIHLNRAIGVDHVRVTIAIPLPNTRFEKHAMEQGLLKEYDGASKVATLMEPEVLFETEERDALVNLYMLFRLAVHVPASEGLVRRIINRTDARWLQAFRLWGIYEEKQITQIRWMDGLRYFSHVGDPRKRTANYVTLI